MNDTQKKKRGQDRERNIGFPQSNHIRPVPVSHCYLARCEKLVVMLQKSGSLLRLPLFFSLFLADKLKFIFIHINFYYWDGFQNFPRNNHE